MEEGGILVFVMADFREMNDLEPYYNAGDKHLINGFGGETKLGRVSMK